MVTVILGQKLVLEGVSVLFGCEDSQNVDASVWGRSVQTASALCADLAQYPAACHVPYNGTRSFWLSSAGMPLVPHGMHQDADVGRYRALLMRF
jgi:hypothetical protein